MSAEGRASFTLVAPVEWRSLAWRPDSVDVEGEKVRVKSVIMMNLEL